MFDPSIGTWVSRDPLGFEAGDADLYRYCGNGPTNFVDPSGMDEYGIPNFGDPERERWHRYSRSPTDIPTEDPKYLALQSQAKTTTPDGIPYIRDTRPNPMNPERLRSPEIIGPGRLLVPNNAAVLYSDRLDEFKTWWDQIPKGTIITSVGSWIDIASFLGTQAAGSIQALFLSGHSSGSGGGIRGSSGGMNANNLREEQFAIIDKILAPNAPIVIAACGTENTDESMQAMADRLRRPVYASTASTVLGAQTDGNWVVYRPKTDK
jgi:hypothetical protein